MKKVAGGLTSVMNFILETKNSKQIIAIKKISFLSFFYAEMSDGESRKLLRNLTKGQLDLVD